MYIEIVLAANCFIAGVWFWALQKCPTHLQRALEDEGELRSFLRDMELEKFRAEGEAIPGVPGTFADRINDLGRAHRHRLKWLGWLVAIFSALLLLATYFISSPYLFINVPLFLIPSLFPPGAYTEKNNFSFLYSVALNLYKWNEADVAQCRRHCTEVDPRLRRLYSAVQKVSPEGSGTPRETPAAI